jgi:hypothetical protein
MSYMRVGYPLRYFMGLTESYIWRTDDNIVEDYGDNYKNNPSFIELIGRYVKMATKDEKYFMKIMKILATKLDCSDKMRDHELTYEENKEEEKMLDNIRLFIKEHDGKAMRALHACDMYFDLEDIMNAKLEEDIVEMVYLDGHLTREEKMIYITNKINKRKEEKKCQKAYLR